MHFSERDTAKRHGDVNKDGNLGWCEDVTAPDARGGSRHG